jgi:hypothetical protein
MSNAPRLHRDLYDPYDDTSEVDPERSIHRLLVNRRDMFVMIHTHYNADEEDLGTLYKDLTEGEVYVKAIEVLSIGRPLDILFLRSIHLYCPTLEQVEPVGENAMRFRFIHPKFA